MAQRPASSTIPLTLSALTRCRSASLAMAGFRLNMHQYTFSGEANGSEVT